MDERPPKLAKLFLGRIVSAPDKEYEEEEERPQFLVSAEKLATNALIVATSGSGKSYFLGRLIEELIGRTLARCVVLDPNSDFWRICDVLTENWPADPDEPSRADFAEAWTAPSFAIRNAKLGVRGRPYEPVAVPWPLVSMDLLADEIPAAERPALYKCHSVVRSLAELRSLLSNDHVAMTDITDGASRYLSTPGLAKSELGGVAQKKSVEAAAARMFKGDEDDDRLLSWLKTELTYHAKTIVDAEIPEGVRAFYFGKVRSFSHDGLIGSYLSQSIVPAPSKKYLEIVDLPSLRDKSAQQVAMSGRVAAEWTRARLLRDLVLSRPAEVDAIKDPRTLSFVVVDEAHNVIPSDGNISRAQAAIREQFRTIAAEGRKYGVHLILATQRPEKLDPVVVSECGAVVMMRFDSRGNDASIQAILGLPKDATSRIPDCARFGVGRGLVFGQWVGGGACEVQFARRRTIDSGRNLRPETWAATE